MRPPWRLLGVVWVAAAALAGCSRGAMPESEEMSARLDVRINDEARARLAAARIYFGHQSIGANAADGLAVVAREHGLHLNIVKGHELSAAGTGCFAHEYLGGGERPQARTDAFAALLEGGLGRNVDVALHKYCYLDITEETDVDAIFVHYTDTMARLRREFPRVSFVHVTVPLVRLPWWPKPYVKQVLGRGTGDYGDNQRREQFNDRMRRTYLGHEPVFDLAAVESSGFDGARHAARFRGAVTYGLLASYTDDGGHLNALGRRRAGEQLLLTLVDVVSRSPGARVAR